MEKNEFGILNDHMFNIEMLCKLITSVRCVKVKKS